VTGLNQDRRTLSLSTHNPVGKISHQSVAGSVKTTVKYSKRAVLQSVTYTPWLIEIISGGISSSKNSYRYKFIDDWSIHRAITDHTAACVRATGLTVRVAHLRKSFGRSDDCYSCW